MSYCVTDGDEPAKAPEAKKKQQTTPFVGVAASDAFSTGKEVLCRATVMSLVLR